MKWGRSCPFLFRVAIYQIVILSTIGAVNWTGQAVCDHQKINRLVGRCSNSSFCAVSKKKSLISVKFLNCLEPRFLHLFKTGQFQ